MFTERGRPGPQPAPKIPMAARLEDVRQLEGYRDRKAFYHAVLEGADPDNNFPGYESALRYHFDREAPARYLAAVAKRFGYRLLWLATGEGARKESDEKLQRSLDETLDDKILNVFPEYGSFPPAVRAQVHSLVARWSELMWLRARTIDRESDLVTPTPVLVVRAAQWEAAELEFLRHVRESIVQPLRVWNIEAERPLGSVLVPGARTTCTR